MKLYIKSMESIFAGTKYDKQAVQILVNSGIFREPQAKAIIDALYHEDLHAFIHSPNWLEKYLKGIARMCVEESHGTARGVADFLNISVSVFDQFLTYVKDNRDELGGVKFDDKFNNEMSYQDVVYFMNDITDSLDRESDTALAEMTFEPKTTQFKLVPITSYAQFNEDFGGTLTGDGSPASFSGDPSSMGNAWCHANSKFVYDTWVQRGKLYVLANKYYKRIKFNPESNSANPKDKYGNSLIAILVDPQTGRLLNATLRCNHVGVPTSPDNQYHTYAELSDVAGFNVKDAVMTDLGLI